MMVLVNVIVAIGVVISAIELSVMGYELVSYIRYKKFEKMVKKEMLKKFKKI